MRNHHQDTNQEINNRDRSRDEMIEDIPEDRPERQQVLSVIYEQEERPTNPSPNYRERRNSEEVQQLRPIQPFNIQQPALNVPQVGQILDPLPQEQQPVTAICRPHFNRYTVIAALVSMGMLALIISLLVAFLSREVITTKRETTIFKVGYWQSIRRIFYNLSEPSGLGYVDDGPGAASIVYTSTNYVSDPSLRRLEQDANDQWSPYGYNDLYDIQAGVTARALNPENRIYYVEKEKIIERYHQSHHSSNLITQALSVNQSSNSNYDKYFPDALTQAVAAIEKVDKSRVIVVEEEFWIGKPDGNLFSIVLVSELPANQSSLKPGNKTADEIKVEAQAIIDQQVIPILKQKVQQHQDFGTLIADQYGFSFSRTVQLYTTQERNHSLQSNSSDESEEDNSTNQTKIYVPKAPVIVEVHHEPILPQRPKRVSQGLTIPKSTYQSIINCVDYSSQEKACSVSQWLREDSPYKITEASMAKKEQFKSYKRYRIFLKPLPPDQVHQEMVESTNSLEMWLSQQQVSDDYLTQDPLSSPGQV